MKQNLRIKSRIFKRLAGDVLQLYVLHPHKSVPQQQQKYYCIGVALTPSHIGDNMLHENLSLDSVLHTLVFHQTTDCSDLLPLSLHLPHVETVKNIN